METENVGHDDHSIWEKAIEKKKEEAKDQEIDKRSEKVEQEERKKEAIKRMAEMGEKKIFK